MKKYKGQYIDGVIFKTSNDVDEFLKQCAYDAYKTACELFIEKPSVATSIYMDEKATVLHDQYGMGWDEIQEIENMVWGV